MKPHRGQVVGNRIKIMRKGRLYELARQGENWMTASKGIIKRNTTTVPPRAKERKGGGNKVGEKDLTAEKGKRGIIRQDSARTKINKLYKQEQNQRGSVDKGKRKKGKKGLLQLNKEESEKRKDVGTGATRLHQGGQRWGRKKDSRIVNRGSNQ